MISVSCFTYLAVVGFTQVSDPTAISSAKATKHRLVNQARQQVRRTDLLSKINALRKSNSLPRLSLDCKLTNAAQFMAEDMATRNYMAHVTKSGLDISARVALHGRKQFLILRENIAAGNSSTSKTMQQWIDSPTHYKNLIADDVNVCGIGYAKGPKSTYTHYWVLDLGHFPE